MSGIFNDSGFLRNLEEDASSSYIFDGRVAIGNIYTDDDWALSVCGNTRFNGSLLYMSNEIINLGADDNQVGGVQGRTFGSNNVTVGNNTIAAGFHTRAGADQSIAVGEGTVMNTVDGMAVGRYNTTSANVLFVVGAGTAANPVDAFSVRDDGTVVANTFRTSGSLSVTGPLEGTLIGDVDPDNSTYGIAVYSGSRTQVYSAANVSIGFSSNTSPAIRDAFVFTPDGRFGVGTTLPTANVCVMGNAAVYGDMFVHGNTIQLNANDVNISDPVLLLAANSIATGATTQDVGFVGERAGGNIAVVWDQSKSEFAMFTTSQGGTSRQFTDVNYANLHIDSLSANNINVTGGAAIGGKSSFAGDVAYTGNLAVQGVTAARLTLTQAAIPADSYINFFPGQPTDPYAYNTTATYNSSNQSLNFTAGNKQNLNLNESGTTGVPLGSVGWSFIAALTMTSSQSGECYIKCSSSFYGQTNQLFVSRQFTNVLNFYMYDANNRKASIAATIQVPTTECTVAATFDPLTDPANRGILTLYLNGLQIAQTNLNQNADAGCTMTDVNWDSLIFGGVTTPRSNLDTGFYQGALYHCQLYNRALTGTEVSTINGLWLNPPLHNILDSSVVTIDNMGVTSVKGPSRFYNDVTANSGLTVANTANVGALSVQGDGVVGGNVTTRGQTVQVGNVFMSNNLTVSVNANVQNALNVGNVVTTGSDIFVGNSVVVPNTTTTNDLFVSNSVNVNSIVNVTGTVNAGELNVSDTTNSFTVNASYLNVYNQVYVACTAIFESGLTVDYDGVTVINGGVTVLEGGANLYGNVTISSDVPNGGIDSGCLTVGDTVFTNMLNVAQNVNVADTVTVGSELIVQSGGATILEGGATIQGDVNISSDAGDYGFGTGNLTVSGASTLSGDLTMTNDQNVLLSGDAWGKGAIHLNSSISGASTSTDFMIQRGGIATEKDFLVIHTASTQGAGIKFGCSNDLYRMMVDCYTGYVGINKQSPQAYLDVNGNAAISATNTLPLFVQLNGTTATNGLALELSTPAAGDIGLCLNQAGVNSVGIVQRSGNSGTGNAGRLAFVQNLYPGNAGNEQMCIQQNGSVGINTTTPQNTLDVSGTVHISSYLQVGDTAATDMAISSLQSTMGVGTFRGIVQGQSSSPSNRMELWYTYAGSSSSNNRVTLGLYGTPTISVWGNGNVGVNVSSPPAYQFTVNGSMGVTGTSTLPTVISNNVTISSPNEFPFNINMGFSAGANGYSHACNILNPAMANNEAYIVQVGQSAGGYNSAYYGYVSGGASSANSYATIGLFGVDRVLNVTGQRFVGLNTTTPAYTLDVNGTSRVTGVANFQAVNATSLSSTGTISGPVAATTLSASGETNLAGNAFVSQAVYLGNNRAGIYREGGIYPITYLHSNDRGSTDNTLPGGAFAADGVNSRFSWLSRLANSTSDTTLATLSWTSGNFTTIGNVSATNYQSPSSNGGVSQAGTVGTGDRLVLYPPTPGYRPYSIGYNSAQARVYDGTTAPCIWMTMPGIVNGFYRFEIGAGSVFEINQSAVTSAPSVFNIGSGPSWSGLVQETSGTSALFDMQVNFRGNVNTTNQGSAYRIDTRGAGATGYALHQWMNRYANTSTETAIMSLDPTGSLSLANGISSASLTSTGNISGPVNATTLAATGTSTLQAVSAASLTSTGNISGPVNATTLAATGTSTLQAVSAASLTSTGNISGPVNATTLAATGTSTLQAVSAASLTSTGNISGPVNATTLAATGTSTLQAVSAASLTSTGNISGPVNATTLAATGTSTLQAVTAASLTSTGNISGPVNATTLAATGTSTLHAVSAASLTSTGNISGPVNATVISATGASTLQAVTATTLTVTGNVAANIIVANAISLSSNASATYYQSPSTNGGPSQVSTVGPGDRLILSPPTTNLRPFSIGYNSSQARVYDGVVGPCTWMTVPGGQVSNSFYRLEIGGTSMLEVNGIATTSTPPVFNVGAGPVWCGLVQETSGNSTLFDMQVNFRGSANTAYQGSAYRMDTRGNGATGYALHQWFNRYATSTTETQIMSLDPTGSLTLANNMYVSGNVGVGTTTPAYPFDVGGQGRFTASNTVPLLVQVSNGTSASNGLALQMSSTAGAGDIGIGFNQAGVNSYGIVQRSGSSSTSNAGRVSFVQNLYPGNGGTEQMCILQNGNVGINTTTPAYLLDVGGVSRFQNSVLVNSSDNTCVIADAGNNSRLGFVKQSGQSPKIVAASGNPIVLGISNQGDLSANISSGTVTEGFRLHSNGYVGINNSSPTYPLDVSGGTIRSTSTGTGLICGDQTPDGTSRAIMALLSTQATGSTRYITLGVSQSTNNQAEFAFVYAGSGSSSNRIGLGLYGGERMSILGSGNIGINNSSPSYALDVSGVIRSTSVIWLNNQIQNQMLCLYTSDSGPSSGSTNYYGFGINSNTLRYNVPSSTAHVFYQNTTEYMRVHTNGYVGINQPSPASPLDVNGDLRYSGYMYGVNAYFQIKSGAGLAGNNLFHVNGASGIVNQAAVAQFEGNPGTACCIGTYMSATSQNDQVVFHNPNGRCGAIQTNGTSTSYVTSSDYRLKTRRTPYTQGLELVNSLKPTSYVWTTDNAPGVGFIAHEVQELVPDAVSGEKDEVDRDGVPQYQGVDYSKLVVYLVSAVQDLSQQVRTLQQDNADLNAKYDRLAAKVHYDRTFQRQTSKSANAWRSAG